MQNVDPHGKFHKSENRHTLVDKPPWMHQSKPKYKHECRTDHPKKIWTLQLIKHPFGNEIFLRVRE